MRDAIVAWGGMRPTTLSEAMKFAEMIAGSDMVPKQYQRKPADILIAVQMGSELGLAPMQSLQNIATINGKPSIYGDAMLALVRASPACEDVIEHAEGEGDAMAAVCEARRRGKAPVIARFSVADARRAGLWGKAGPWLQYPRRMLQFRARGFALRDAFPDILRGVISAEEAQDYPASARDIAPPATVAGDLEDFAGAGSPEPAAEAAIDPLMAAAGEMSDLGAAAFRAWWRRLGGAERELLRALLPGLRRRAQEADDKAAAAAEPASEAEAADPFGLPPIPEQAPLALADTIVPAIAFRKALGQTPDYLGTMQDLMSAGLARKTVTALDAFRRENTQTINLLRIGDAESWETMQAALAGHERALRENGR